MSNLKIRLVKKEDLDDLAKIYQKIYKKDDWEILYAKKYLSRFYKYQKDLFFIAELKGKIVGAATGEIKSYCSGEDLSEVEIFVDPKVHGKGIGKRLFTTLIANALKKYHVVDIQGIADNSKKFPMQWYGKIGWGKTGWVHLRGDAKEILKNLGK